MKWPLVGSMFLWSLSTMVRANMTLSEPTELVLVIDISEDIALDKMLGIVRDFSAHFPMSESGTRIAVISFSRYAKISLELTGNENSFQNFKLVQRDEWRRTDLALNEVEKVLKKSRPDAAKLVVLITDGQPSFNFHGSDFSDSLLDSTVKAAKKIQDDGASIFVVFIGDIYHQSEKFPEFFIKLARDKSRIMLFPDMKSKKEIFDNLLKTIICNFEPICVYDQNDACVPHWWRPMQSNVTCDNDPPSINPPDCLPHNCIETCEKWLWRNKTCNESDADGVADGVVIVVQEQSTFRMIYVTEYCPKCPVYPINIASSVNETGVSPLTPEESISPIIDPHITDRLAIGDETSVAEGGLAAWIIALIVISIVLSLTVVAVVTVIVINQKKSGAAVINKRSGIFSKKDGVKILGLGSGDQASQKRQ